MIGIPAIIMGGSKLLKGIFTVSAALGPLLLVGMAAQHVKYEGWPIFGGGEIAKLEDQRDKWQLASQKWETAHAKQVRYFELAKKAGEEAAEQARTDYDQAARRADNAQYEIDKLRSAAQRYAAAARVRDPGRNQRRPAETDPAKGGDGPGSDAELYGVFVTRNDFDVLVENSLRLERVWRWGHELIDLKRAVTMDDAPLPSFGK